jgi:hypothetical protein
LVEDFVDMCAFCKQGVPRANMVYQKGLVFHSQCYTDHGNDFAAPDPELAQLSARTRVELVQLKNMRVRSETQKQSSSPVKKVKEKSRKRPKKTKKIKAKRPKSKAKRVKRKAGKAKKKSGRRR